MTAPTSPDVPARAANRRAQLLAAALWCGAVPVAAMGTSIAFALAWRNELPDPVTTGWGPDGTPRTGSLTGQLVGLGGLALGFALLGLALTIWLGQAALTRRIANAVAAGAGTLAACLLYVQLDAQRGVAPVAEHRPAGGAVAAAVGLTLLVVALAATLTPADPPRPTRVAPPADAPSLPLEAGEEAVWVSELGRGRRPWVLAATVATTSLVWVLVGWQWALLPLLLTPLFLLTLLEWTVTVDARGLTARGAGGLVTQHVPLDEVERATAIHIDPLRQWGGWGVRTALDGSTGVIVRTGEGIEVHRTGGRRFVVSIHDAAQGAALLNALAARGRVSGTD